MTALSLNQPKTTGAHDQPPRQITRNQIEIGLVIITALALVSSLLAERLEAPALLITVFNLIAYAAGGYFGTRASLESLKIIKPAEDADHHDSCCAVHADEGPKFNIDTLMILAAVGAALVDQWHEGAMLLFLFSLSNVLQDYAIGRSRQAIRSLMKLYPDEVRVIRDGKKQMIKLDEIRIGEIVMIEPGERIPVDGLVRDGRSAVDQSPITGESMPVDKIAGDHVFAGTLNTQGVLDVEATQEARDTVLSRIIRMVEDAQDSKAPTERFLEKFEEYYALVIIVGIALFIVIPPMLGMVEFTPNFYRAMVLMTVAAPCALVISTPAAFLSAIASAARGGVLFKGGAYIENLAGLKAIAFDKTGTLTTGKPTVTDIIPHAGIDENELLRIAASAEDRSQHPLAKAVVNAATKHGIKLAEVSNFEAISGRGVQVTVDGK
ncbi:MAG TPA: heavy metal translocating P-type ATPase, partial [Phototrophicaceae bacterium]|nr:heavy metal translocating P-type ATPase [Phototrophicaceae bacterium]